MLIPNPKNTALVLVDMQNDFLHPEGAYGRAGQGCEAIAALPERHLRLAQAMRKAGGWIVSTHFTLVPGKSGEPFISPHLRKLRPFLGKGDFTPGAFGHQLIDLLQPADLSVEKVAFSAFFQTRLDWVLNRANITDLIFGASSPMAALLLRSETPMCGIFIVLLLRMLVRRLMMVPIIQRLPHFRQLQKLRIVKM